MAWRGLLVIPGVLHVVAVTALAFLLAALLPDLGVGATAFGVLLGLVAGNVLALGPVLGPGVRWAAKRFLTAAVVLLGLRVTLAQVVGLGGTALLVVAVAVVVAPFVALRLGRALRVPAPLAACIGAGTGVCGVSAIAAVRGVVGARDEQVTYAVAAVTLLGSLGLVVYPLVQWAWHPFDAASYGILAGGTLHSVPQAVGAGFAGGGLAAGAIATVVKLGRVAMIGPMAVAFGVQFAREERGRAVRLPVEVWGFLALFLLGSLVRLPGTLVAGVAVVDEILLVLALSALGLLTRFADLRRVGARPLVVAGTTWLVLVVLVVAVLHLT